jgi:hypothetical protein
MREGDKENTYIRGRKKGWAVKIAKQITPH